MCKQAFLLLLVIAVTGTLTVAGIYCNKINFTKDVLNGTRVVIRLFIFSLSCVGQIHTFQGIKQTHTFGEYFLSSIVTAFSPLNQVQYYFQLMLHFAIHSIVIIIELKLGKKFWKGVKYCVVLFVFFCGIQFCLRKYFMKIADAKVHNHHTTCSNSNAHPMQSPRLKSKSVMINSSASRPNILNSPMSMSSRSSNKNMSSITGSINSPSDRQPYDNKVWDHLISQFNNEAKSTMIYGLLLFFFVMNILEAYQIDYKQDGQDQQCDEILMDGNINYNTTVCIEESIRNDKNESLTIYVNDIVESMFMLWCGDSWRDVIVFFIVNKMILVFGVITSGVTALGVYYKNKQDNNLATKRESILFFALKPLLMALNGIFVYFIVLCGHRMLILTLSLLIIAEINKLTNYLDHYVIPRFKEIEWMSTFGDNNSKITRYDEIKRLEDKKRKQMPIVNDMVLFVTIFTFLYFCMDMWIQECTLYDNASIEHKFDLSRGLWYNLTSFKDLRKARHLFIILLNLLVIWQIYSFNTSSASKLSRVFQSNKAKIWYAIQFSEKYKNETPNNQDRLLNDFEKEYLFLHEHFENVILKTFGFKICGLMAGRWFIYVAGLFNLGLWASKALPKGALDGLFKVEPGVIHDMVCQFAMESTMNQTNASQLALVDSVEF